MNEIRIFDSPEFGEVRTVMIDGEPWFVGKDVAESLGYKNTRQALSTNVMEEDKGVNSMDTPSGTQQMTIINESGLYSLIFGSKLESAKKFKRWVTSEVLPQLRKTGGYQLSDLRNNPMKLLEVHYEAIRQVDHKADMALDKADKLSEQFKQFKESLPLLPEEAESLSGAVKKRVVQVLGGKTSEAYRNRSICQTAFFDAYRNLKRNFNVRSYKCIKRCQVDIALQVAESWTPPVFLQEKIKNANAQMSFSEEIA